MAKTKLSVLVLLALLWGHQADAATYYVATTGNDSTGNGSESTPWRNPQKCFSSGSPLVAGDTCLVKSGTYTNPGDGSVSSFKGRVVVINSSSPVATAANPIILKSEVPLGATIEVPNVWPGVDCAVSSCPYAGIYISGGGSYYIIEGFQFTSPGSTQLANATFSGVTVLSAATGIITRGNSFHDIARTVCSNSIFGNVGIHGTNSTGFLIENNLFYTIGRRRNGESGCSTTIFGHDHAIYFEASTDLTIRRNICYDTTRGHCVVAKARTAGTKTLRLSVYNNTFADESPTTKPEAPISLSNSHDDTRIKNNIMMDPEGGYLVWAATPPASYALVPVGAGVIVQNNLSNSTNAQTNIVLNQSSFSLLTVSGNILNTSPGFVNGGARDYRLASGSAAIDAGENVGLPFGGSKPDAGAYESYSHASASINGHTMDLVTDATFTPLQAASGAVGWSVGCSGTGCLTPSVTSVTATGGTLRLDLAGMSGGNCAAGQTWTVTYNAATGTVTDNQLIPTTKQALYSLTSFPVTNNCSGSPPAGYPAGYRLYYKLDENTGTNANDESANNLDGTLTGGAGWGVGKSGSGLSLTAQSGQYLAIPWGSGVDPGSQDFTFAFWVNIPEGSQGLARSLVGASLGDNQRLYTVINSGEHRIGVQGSNAALAGNIAARSGWQHVCLNNNATTNTVTLYVDGVASTASGAVKTHSGSWTLASNLELGRIGGLSDGVGGVFDEFILYESSESCAAIYAAANPVDSSGGTFTLQTHRFESPRLLTGATVDVRSANGAELTAIRGAEFAVHAQIRCDNVSACDAQTFPPWYSLDGATYIQAVPDSPTGDGVSWLGTSSESALNQGVADGPLSAGLTHVDGGTVVSGAGLQSYTLAQNTSLTLRYLFKIAPTFAGTALWIRPHRSLGAPLDTYSSTIKINVVQPRASGQQ